MLLGLSHLNFSKVMVKKTISENYFRINDTRNLRLKPGIFATLGAFKKLNSGRKWPCRSELPSFSLLRIQYTVIVVASRVNWKEKEYNNLRSEAPTRSPLQISLEAFKISLTVIEILEVW